MKSKFVIETGNTSWWKNVKYRRKAAETIRNYRKLGYKLKKQKLTGLVAPILLFIQIMNLDRLS